MHQKLVAKDFACRSLAKAKPQRRKPAGSSPRTVPIEKRILTDVEPGKCVLDFEVSKKLTHFLRHAQDVHRENGGTVQFWRIKEILQKYFPYCFHWFDSKWKRSMAGGGGIKNKYQNCTFLQEQLCISEIFKDIQEEILLILLYRTM